LASRRCEVLALEQPPAVVERQRWRASSLSAIEEVRGGEAIVHGIIWSSDH
jgi:hypothetical protein